MIIAIGDKNATTPQTPPDTDTIPSMYMMYVFLVSMRIINV